MRPLVEIHLGAELRCFAGEGAKWRQFLLHGLGAVCNVCNAVDPFGFASHLEVSFPHSNRTAENGSGNLPAPCGQDTAVRPSSSVEAGSARCHPETVCFFHPALRAHHRRDGEQHSPAVPQTGLGVCRSSRPTTRRGRIFLVSLHRSVAVRAFLARLRHANSRGSVAWAALNGQLVRTMRRTFTGALPDNSDKGREENMALLPLALCDAQVSRCCGLCALHCEIKCEKPQSWLKLSPGCGLLGLISQCTAMLRE